MHVAKKEDEGSFLKTLSLNAQEDGQLGDKPFTMLYNK